MNQNRFSHITSQRRVSKDVANSHVSVKGKPDTMRLGREAYDTLMSLLSEDTETPTTPYGVLLANSTKRNIRKQVEDLFKP